MYYAAHLFVYVNESNPAKHLGSYIKEPLEVFTVKDAPEDNVIRVFTFAADPFISPTCILEAWSMRLCHRPKYQVQVLI